MSDEYLCFFTSREPIGNLAFHVGDDIQRVNKNHLLLSQKLAYEQEHLVHMKQIHSNIVHVVTDEDGFSSPPTCDALVTNKKNTPLMVMVADCTPVLFYDSTCEVPFRCKAIGVAHVGREGAFSNIVKNVLKTMEQEYGSCAEDIFIEIGSSIGVCCYEVGQEIYDKAQPFHYAFTKGDTSYYLDVNKIILTQLKECGIKEENIKNEGVCTACNTKNYFSYRKEGKTGRFAGILMIRD